MANGCAAPSGKGVWVSQESNVLERTIEGNLWTQYDGINDVLTAVNRPFRLKGEQSETVLPYPPLALKEVVVNALVHRDYAVTNPIMIEVTASGIRITNPGGLVDEVQRRVEAGSVEEEIRRGRRGIRDTAIRSSQTSFTAAAKWTRPGPGSPTFTRPCAPTAATCASARRRTTTSYAGKWVMTA